MNWFAIYTKPKCEESTARLLASAGIETLSPMIRVLKRVRGKYADVIEPLFPSYVFARMDRDRDSRMVRYTRGVRYIVGRDDPITVPPEIIRAIRERMQDGVVMPVPEEMRKGQRVMIKEGPFKDFYGVFERALPGKERAMILLEALHCSLQIGTRSIRKA